MGVKEGTTEKFIANVSTLTGYIENCLSLLDPVVVAENLLL